MSKEDREMDEYGNRVLTPLQATQPIDPAKAKAIRKNYLIQAETLRKEMSSQESVVVIKQDNNRSKKAGIRRTQPLFKVLAGILLAVFLLVVGSASVYAANNSLPGEPLYAIKTLVEDVQLSLVTSPQARLELTLNYTNRRMDEITSLITAGKFLPEKASQRFRGELEGALLLAAEMNDMQMQKALGKIKLAAEHQGMTIDELIEKLPDNAEPAITRLQERLQEQVHLSEFGERDPQAFRTQIHGRRLQQNNPGFNKTTRDADTTTTPEPATDFQETDVKKNENGNGQPQGGASTEDEPGQGNDNPGNENHGPNKTTTP